MGGLSRFQRKETLFVEKSGGKKCAARAWEAGGGPECPLFDAENRK